MWEQIFVVSGVSISDDLFLRILDNVSHKNGFGDLLLVTDEGKKFYCFYPGLFVRGPFFGFANTNRTKSTFL